MVDPAERLNVPAWEKSAKIAAWSSPAVLESRTVLVVSERVALRSVGDTGLTTTFETVLPVPAMVLPSLNGSTSPFVVLDRAAPKSDELIVVESPDEAVDTVVEVAALRLEERVIGL